MPTREQLRTFHLTGTGLNAFAPQSPLRPVLFDQLQLAAQEHHYPLYFTDSEPPRPFWSRLQPVLGAVLQDYAELIVGGFAEQIATRESTTLSSVWESAVSAIRSRLEMLHVPLSAVAKELDALRTALPGSGRLIPFGTAAPQLTLSAILDSERREARQSFGKELREAGQRLREMLAADQPKSRSLTASLGGRASVFLNPSLLTDGLRRRKSSTIPLEPESRERSESALATIEDAVADLNRQSSVVLVQGTSAPDGDACAHAEHLCQRQRQRHTAVLKALRIARLELESAFDPAVHPEAFDSFDCSMAHPHELAALPVVLVVESGEQIQKSPASLLRLLRSDLPVKVLVTSASPADDPGCLPLVCQDAFVLHSSVAATDHLLNGLTAMAQTLRPSVAVVAVSDSWKEAALLPLARACPLYRYDPGVGESWHQRFALQPGAKPQVEELTYPHVAAGMPAFLNQFRVLPEPPDAVFPCLPVTGEDGELRYAVFTRELAKTGAAVQRRERLLAELAAPQIVKEADRSAEGRARADGATQAIHRVISILTNA